MVDGRVALLLAIACGTFACAHDLPDGWRLLTPNQYARRCEHGWAYLDHDGALRIASQDALPEPALPPEEYRRLPSALVPVPGGGWLRARTDAEGELGGPDTIERSAGPGQPFEVVGGGVGVAMVGDEFLVAIGGGTGTMYPSRIERWSMAGELIEAGPNWNFFRIVGFTVADGRPWLVAFVELDSHYEGRFQLLSLGPDYSLNFEHELPDGFYWDSMDQATPGVQLIAHGDSFYLSAREETLLRVQRSIGPDGEPVYVTSEVVSRSCRLRRSKRPVRWMQDPIELRYENNYSGEPLVVSLATAKALRKLGVELDFDDRQVWPTQALHDFEAAFDLFAELGPDWTLVTLLVDMPSGSEQRLPPGWTMKVYPY